MERKENHAGWMRGKYGGMSHWLFSPVGTGATEGDPEELVQEWNRRVDHFDVEKLSSQLKEAGVTWFILTLGQNSGYYCSPNRKLDEFTGRVLSRCSKRDLFLDLAKALKVQGIRLIAYLPSGAPDRDFDACMALQWRDGYFRDDRGRPVTMPDGVRPRRPNHRLAEFQRMWEAVIREWALAWGEHLAGWWIDGVYFADQMYDFKEEPNFASFASALRAGNPKAALSFNSGIMRVNEPKPTSLEEDFSAGELNSYFFTPFGRSHAQEDIRQGNIGHTQLHLLDFLGTNWGQGETPRFPDDLTHAWTNYIMENGGAVTWDVPTNAIGEIPDTFIQTLKSLKHF